MEANPKKVPDSDGERAEWGLFIRIAPYPADRRYSLH